MALTGRAVLLLLGGLLVLPWQPTETAVRLWWLGVAAVVALDVALAPSPSRLRITRAPVAAVRLGDHGETTLTVVNTSPRRVDAQIRDAWQPSAGAQGERRRLRLPARGQAEVRTRLTPTRRGDRRADRVTIRVRGPLGLACRQSSRQAPGAIRALPAFASRQRLPSLLASLRELDGRSAVRVRGQGTEFDSLRDYVAGDDVRSIDWRASARRARGAHEGRSAAVVRTWQPERDRHVVLLLDTSRTSAGRVEDMPRLDAAMDAALLLSALASHAGDRVHVLAGDRRLLARASTPNRGQLLHEVAHAMAGLEPTLLEADWTVLAGQILHVARRRALVVLLTPLEPAAIEEGLIPVLSGLTGRHEVVLASVRDPALDALTRDVQTVEQAYQAAAAEQTLARRRHTAAVLKKLGVGVVDAPPAELPMALCERYLTLKRRGRL